jgi:hypothetical protein
MMTRPNLRFSFIVFGTASLYTVLNSIPSWKDESGLSLPILLVSLGLALVMTLAFENGRTNHR